MTKNSGKILLFIGVVFVFGFAAAPFGVYAQQKDEQTNAVFFEDKDTGYILEVANQEPEYQKKDEEYQKEPEKEQSKEYITETSLNESLKEKEQSTEESQKEYFQEKEFSKEPSSENKKDTEYKAERILEEAEKESAEEFMEEKSGDSADKEEPEDSEEEDSGGFLRGFWGRLAGSVTGRDEESDVAEEESNDSDSGGFLSGLWRRLSGSPDIRDTTREIAVVVEVNTVCGVDVPGIPSEIQLSLRNRLDNTEYSGIILSRARTDIANRKMRRIDRYEGRARLVSGAYTPLFSYADFSGRVWAYTPDYLDSTECAAGVRYLRGDRQRLNPTDVAMTISRGGRLNYDLREDQSLLVIQAVNNPDLTALNLPESASMDIPSSVCDISGCD